MKTAIKFEYPFEIVKAYEEGKKDEKEDTSKWYVEGLASTSDFDLSGDIIDSDAYKDAEKDLLQNSTVLDNHDPNKRIGHIVECKAQDEGLWVKVLISKTARDIWQQIKEGVLNKFSIRGRIIDAVKKYVKELGRIANIIKKMYLMECSLVSLPANPQAKTMRWYISKSIEEFEKGGGEIPLEKEKGENMNLDTIASTLESMKDRLSEEDKNTISEIVESVKAKEKYPYGYPYPKQKDESDKDYEGKLAKDFEEFLAARKKKKEEEEEAEKARKKKEEEEEVEKARKKKEEEEEVEKARKKKEEEEEAEKARKKKEEEEETEKARKKKEEEEEEAEKARKKKEKYPYGYPYPKKKSGDAYSQEEIDGILADFRASVEDYFEEKLTKKDKALMDLKDDLMEKLNVSQKENEGLKADRQVEEEWNKISDSYKEEDADAIKGILKKTFLGQPLKPEEQNTLIEKKLSSDLMVGGGGPESIFSMTPEKEKEIIEYAGIKTRVNKNS